MESERDKQRRFKLYIEYLKENETYKKKWENFKTNSHRLNFRGKNIFSDFSFYDHWFRLGCPKSIDDINPDDAYRTYCPPTGPVLEFNLSEGLDWLIASIQEKDAEKQSSEKILIDTGKRIRRAKLEIGNGGKRHVFLDNRLPASDILIQGIKTTFCRENDLYVKIDAASDYSLQEIATAIKELVTKERNRHSINKPRKRRAGLDELERYLKVFKAREVKINGLKTKWKKVHEQLSPGKEFTEEARQRLNSDYRLARAIIDNSIQCKEPRDFPAKV